MTQNTATGICRDRRTDRQTVEHMYSSVDYILAKHRTMFKVYEADLPQAVKQMQH